MIFPRDALAGPLFSLDPTGAEVGEFERVIMGGSARNYAIARNLPWAKLGYKPTLFRCMPLASVAAPMVNGVNRFITRDATHFAKLLYFIKAYDDIYDVLGQHLTPATTRQSIRDGETSFCCLFREMYGETWDKRSFLETFDKLDEYQNASLGQTGPIAYGRLLDVTLNKGAYTTLLSLYYMRDRPTRYERLVAYDFGGLVQLIDDALDVQEDSLHGIRTVFTEGYWEESDLFEYARSRLATVEQRLPYAPSALRLFMMFMNLDYNIQKRHLNSPFDAMLSLLPL